eukprot:8736340-Heterocapsa_arctica.AAC.1
MTHQEVLHAPNAATLTDGFCRAGVRLDPELHVNTGLSQHMPDEQTFLGSRADREQLGLAGRERDCRLSSTVAQHNHPKANNDAARCRSTARAFRPTRVAKDDDFVLLNALASAKLQYP